MATVTDTTKVKFSTHGLAPSVVLDSESLSDRAAEKLDVRRLVIATAAGQKQTAVYIINSTVKHNLGPVGIYGRLLRAYISHETLPAGGTLSAKLVAYDASGNAEVVLTTTIDPEAGTVREAQAFALDTTNVALDPDDTLELHCAASNNAVSQDAQGVSVALIWNPTPSTGNVSTKTTYT